jgi:hypothetical protein
MSRAGKVCGGGTNIFADIGHAVATGGKWLWKHRRGAFQVVVYAAATVAVSMVCAATAGAGCLVAGAIAGAATAAAQDASDGQHHTIGGVAVDIIVGAALGAAGPGGENLAYGKRAVELGIKKTLIGRGGLTAIRVALNRAGERVHVRDTGTGLYLLITAVAR